MAARRLIGRRPLLMAVAIVLVAFNMRAAFVALAPVISDVRDDTGVGTAVAGLLTTLPVLCFVLFSPFVPVLSRRWGSDRVLAAALAILTAGILIRLAPGVAPLFLGTLVFGAAMAAGNVLLPSLVKRHFPERLGTMTGLYVTSMGAGATVAAGVTVPIDDGTGLGWRATVALWALPAALAFAAWMIVRRDDRPDDAVEPAVAVRGLWRNRVAQHVIVFFGTQSFIYYAATAWLPTLLEDAGMSSGSAGLQLAIFNLIGLPISLVVPMAATRRRDQVGLIAASAALTAVGLVGLIAAPLTATVVWIALLGIGQGATVGLALTLIGLRSPDADHAAQLSGIAQSASFAIAATAPFALGALNDLTGSWPIAFSLTLGALAVMTVSGIAAGRDRFARGMAVPASPVVVPSGGSI